MFNWLGDLVIEIGAFLKGLSEASELAQVSGVVTFLLSVIAAIHWAKRTLSASIAERDKKIKTLEQENKAYKISTAGLISAREMLKLQLEKQSLESKHIQICEKIEEGNEEEVVILTSNALRDVRLFLSEGILLTASHFSARSQLEPDYLDRAIYFNELSDMMSIDKAGREKQLQLTESIFRTSKLLKDGYLYQRSSDLLDIASSYDGGFKISDSAHVRNRAVEAYNRQDYALAEVLCRRAITIANRNRDQLKKLSAELMLAKTLQALTELNEALDLAEKVYENLELVTAEDDHLRLDAMAFLVSITSDGANRYDKALILSKDYFKKAKDVFGLDSLKTNNAAFHLIRCLTSLKRIDDAKNIEEQHLKHLSQKLPADNDRFIYWIERKAGQLSNDKDYQGATKIIQDHLAKIIAEGGDTDAQLSFQIKLASTYQHHDKTKALDLIDGVLEQEIPSVKGKVNRAQLLKMKTSYLEECFDSNVREQIFKEIYHLNVAEYGPSSQQAIFALHHLRNFYRNEKLHAKDIETCQDIIQITKNIYGSDNKRILDEENQLAQAFEREGNVERAMEKFEWLVNRSKEILGETHDTSINYISSFAGLLNRLGEDELALSMYIDVWNKFSKKHGEGKTTTLRAHDQIINHLMYQQRKYVEALNYSKKRLVSTSTEFGQESINLHEAKLKHVEILRALESFTQADDEISSILSIYHLQNLSDDVFIKRVKVQQVFIKIDLAKYDEAMTLLSGFAPDQNQIEQQGVDYTLYRLNEHLFKTKGDHVALENLVRETVAARANVNSFLGREFKKFSPTLAEALISQERFSEALEYIEQALDVITNSKGANWHRELSYLSHAVKTSRLTDKLEQGFNYAERALTLVENQKRKNLQPTLSIIHDLSLLYEKDEQIGLALEYIEKAITISESSTGSRTKEYVSMISDKRRMETSY